MRERLRSPALLTGVAVWAASLALPLSKDTHIYLVDSSEVIRTLKQRYSDDVEGILRGLVETRPRSSRASEDEIRRFMEGSKPRIGSALGARTP